MKRKVLWLCLVLLLPLYSQSLDSTDSSQIARNKRDSLSTFPVSSINTKKTIQRSDSVKIASPPKQKNEKNSSEWINITNVLIALGMFIIALLTFIILYCKPSIISRRNRKEYRKILKKELGTIRVLGSPKIDSLPVNLTDAFVSLDLSLSWRCEERFSPDSKDFSEISHQQGLTPSMAVKETFKKYPLLLIIGDPGSGKTTLLQYYAMNCLTGNTKAFGFSKGILPVYFPLRELDFGDKFPAPLAENLSRWAKKRALMIEAKVFDQWLHDHDSLILLDGLDEISNRSHRQLSCQWIERNVNGLPKARFMVTSRPTGYRKRDGIELGCEHLRADVRDFSEAQQEEFLKKWFGAVYRRESSNFDSAEAISKKQQRQLALNRAQVIIDFLKNPDNKGMRELAAIPMLLQIIAILWKEREFKPHTRWELYDAALIYLLEFRDRRKNLYPLLPHNEALRVIQPLALWMQDEIKTDEVLKDIMHEKVQERLDTMDDSPTSKGFCENLRDRAGLLSDYGNDCYIFRHKSFREYLVGLELSKKILSDKKRIDELVTNFEDSWWEEPLRFFIYQVNEENFDQFMDRFFRSDISKNLNDHAQNLLERLIKEAPQKKITALVNCLNDGRLSAQKKRYIINSLKTIGNHKALKALQDFADSPKIKNKEIKKYAQGIVIESGSVDEKVLEKVLQEKGKGSFLNIYEDNAEYLLIPGGKYKYSVSGKLEVVPDMYFAKYELTNKRYNRFIGYLAGQEAKLEEKLSLKDFQSYLWSYADSIDGFQNNLEKKSHKDWADLLRSYYYDNKRFNRAEKPVVGVSWYSASVYCFWLSLLSLSASDNKESIDVRKAINLYRLPTEIEWEWAAAGREPDGSLRKYPWLKDKGEPSEKLANYNSNVGETTPVGRYPEGATPEGLMDMAGNVDEWCGRNTGSCSLRGGSWDVNDDYLRCSARYGFSPDVNDNVGFRVVCPQFVSL